MVWVKKKEIIGRADAKIVREGFIIAEGNTNQSGYSHKDCESNPFRANFRIPIFYIFNVHRNHPMHLFSAETNHIHIYPLKDIENPSRMPANVWKDKMAYDLVALTMFPYDVPIKQDNSSVKKTVIPNGFQKEDSTKSAVSLIYVGNGMSIHCQDQLKVSVVMPSNVVLHIYDWLNDGHKIYSYTQEPLSQKLEGRTELSSLESRSNAWEIIGNLEKRFNTRLTFKTE